MGRKRREDPDLSCRVLAAEIVAEKDARIRYMMLQDLFSKSSMVRPEVKFGAVVQALSSYVPGDVAGLLDKNKDTVVKKPRVDVAFVAVKEMELRAAKLALGIAETATEDRNIAGLRFWFTRLRRQSDRRELSVILTMVGKERNVSCAIACQRMFNAFEVGACFLVGIAAGLKGKVEIGDVVCAELVLDYEHQRLEPSGPKKRPDPYRLDPLMERNLAHFVPERKGWKENLLNCAQKLGSDESPAGLDFSSWDPVYHGNGVILAGEKLIADGSLPGMRDDYHERVRAGEQEGSGFCRACEEYSVPWSVFRGISDYGDPKKKKNWQTVAALSAATAAVTFVGSDYRTREEAEF